MSLLEELHKPDILDCISNLSSDEVFTPPKLVNEILDMLPQELFESPDTKFLDPGCKSGVFLREITKRLMIGLEKQIPNKKKRKEHILKEQIYGVAITELTSIISRRTVYCSKDAKNDKYKGFKFDTKDGNIWFEEKINHIWGPKNKSTGESSCMICGANSKQFNIEGKEKYAYNFIHCSELQNKDLFKRLKEMKFDVIIGNPPYQLGVGNEGGNSSKAKAIYHKFVSQAIKLNPRYITMIIPSRWMTRSVEGIPDSWIDEMINCNKFKILHDFLDASACFPSNPPRGGVCYFLWEKEYNGICNYYLHTVDN